jgi:hypothetical protein
VGKVKQQVGHCEFVVHSNNDRGSGYAVRLYEGGETRVCGRPATVRRNGQNLCKRHDSELSDSDLRELDAIVAQADAAEGLERQRVQLEQRRQRSEERAAELAARAAAWRARNMLQCPQCGVVRLMNRQTGICWACTAQERRRERAEQRTANFAAMYGRGLPLNAEMAKPEPKQPESKPLKETFTGKRLFLKE